MPPLLAGRDTPLPGRLPLELGGLLLLLALLLLGGLLLLLLLGDLIPVGLPKGVAAPPPLLFTSVEEE